MGHRPQSARTHASSQAQLAMDQEYKQRNAHYETEVWSFERVADVRVVTEFRL